MTEANIQELRDAVAAYAQQDAHGGKLLAVLAERVIALDARVSDLEQATAPVVDTPVTKNEKGG